MMRVISNPTWSSRKIWNCFDIVNGATPASGTERFWDGEISWVGPADLGKLSSRAISHGERNLTEAGYKSCGTSFVPEGTIILSARAPIGHVAVAANRLCFNQGCKGLVPNADISGEFAYWLILALRPKLEAAGQGTTFVELSRSKLKDVTFLLPPLPEQRAIAAFLDGKCATIDEAVRIKEEQIRLLRERRQILIQQAVTRGLNPDAPMKDSGIDWIGQIPAHWEAIPLKRLFRERNERTKTGEETLLSLRMVEGLVPHDDVSDKAISDADLIDYKKVFPGQMVMNRMRASIGLFGIVGQAGLVSPDYAIFDMRDDLYGPFFLNLFKIDQMGTRFRLSSRGLGTGSSGFMRLYTDDFGAISVPVPPSAEQKEIVDYIAGVEDKIGGAISLKQTQITALREYKTSLINAAVTGKIKVL